MMEGPEPGGKNSTRLMFVLIVAGLIITTQPIITCVTNLPSDLKSHPIDHLNMNLFCKVWEPTY